MPSLRSESKMGVNMLSESPCIGLYLVYIIILINIFVFIIVIRNHHNTYNGYPACIIIL